jgi:acyl-CoA thioesterase FadM
VVVSTPIGAYPYTEALTVTDDLTDHQGHLNGVAIARIFERVRMGYQRERLPDWRALLPDDVVVTVRELHCRYLREAFPGDRLVGGCRVVTRTEKAYVFDEVLVREVDGTTVAQAWVVMLLSTRSGGRAIPIPDAFWTLVERLEGRAIPIDDRAERPPWGPPGHPLEPT